MSTNILLTLYQTFDWKQELTDAMDSSSVCIMDTQLDLLVPLLLKRAAEVSTAGRDNFLTSTAERSLQALAAKVSPSRFISALLPAFEHRSPTVRAKAASNLDIAVQMYKNNSGDQKVALQVFMSTRITYNHTDS